MPREQLWPRSDTEVGGRARVQTNLTGARQTAGTEVGQTLLVAGRLLL